MQSQIERNAQLLEELRQKDLEKRLSRRKAKQADYKREYRWRRAGHATASVARYEELLAAQGGKCAICGSLAGKKAHVFDERGLICTACHVHVSWLERHRAEVERFLGPNLG